MVICTAVGDEHVNGENIYHLIIIKRILCKFIIFIIIWTISIIGYGGGILYGLRFLRSHEMIDTRVPEFTKDMNYVIFYKYFYCGTLCAHGCTYIYERTNENSWKLLKKFKTRLNYIGRLLLIIFLLLVLHYFLIIPEKMYKIY